MIASDDKNLFVNHLHLSISRVKKGHRTKDLLSRYQKILIFKHFLPGMLFFRAGSQIQQEQRISLHYHVTI